MSIPSNFSFQQLVKALSGDEEKAVVLQQELQKHYSILPEYLTAPQVSLFTGFSVRALEAMRAKRTGPAYVKVGTAKNGPIRYRLDDVRAWMHENREVPHVAR